MLRRLSCGFGAYVIVTMVSACAREGTFHGVISDSVCGGLHPEDEHAPPLSAKECTLRCIRAGATFVLVDSDRRVYTIDDQSDSRLRQHAGEWVTIRGTATNGAIRVSTISPTAPAN
jgi:hypothetical protein